MDRIVRRTQILLRRKVRFSQHHLLLDGREYTSYIRIVELEAYNLVFQTLHRDNFWSRYQQMA